MPPFVCRPANGYTSVCLGAHHVLVADVRRGDEVPTRLQGAREQSENLGQDVTGEVEQRPPPEHTAEGRLIEIGGPVDRMRAYPSTVLLSKGLGVDAADRYGGSVRRLTASR